MHQARRPHEEPSGWARGSPLSQRVQWQRQNCLAWSLTAVPVPPAGMNAAVRAVVRMGIYVGAKVYFIYEVSVASPACFL